METNGHYFKVGLFVILISLALVLSVFWIGGQKWAINQQAYDIYYEDNVSGVLLGAPVFVKGIEAGTITDIRLAQYQGKMQVKIRIMIADDFKIYQGAYANLQMQGITGSSVIEIDPGDPAKALLKQGTKGIPVIPSKQTSIGELLESVPKMVDEFLEIGESVNDILSDQHKKDISQILANVLSITHKFDDNADKMGDVVTDVDEAVKNFDSLMHKLQTTNDELALRGIKTLDNADDFMIAAKKTAQRVDGMIEALEQPVTDFANYGLDEVTLFITELRNLTTQLGKMMQRIERGPTSFLLGKDDDEIKLKK